MRAHKTRVERWVMLWIQTPSLWLTNIGGSNTTWKLLTHYNMSQHYSAMYIVSTTLDICHLYYVDPSNILGIFIHYSYIQAKVGNFVGVILRAPCARITIHPKNISQETYITIPIWIMNSKNNVNSVMLCFFCVSYHEGKIMKAHAIIEHNNATKWCYGPKTWLFETL